MTLQQIRAKFNELEQAKKCPHCSNTLTIEKTKYFITELCEHCFEHCEIQEHKPCCDNPNYHNVKMITSNGVIQVKEQCTNCGNVKSNPLGGFTKEQREALPLLNDAMRDEFYNRYKLRMKLKDKAWEGKHNKWMQNYSYYLNSDAWKNKRAAVLKRDKFLCQCCLESYATQVHHKSYEFVDLNGSEPAFDLVAICKPCHDKIEELKKLRKSI